MCGFWGSCTYYSLEKVQHFNHVVCFMWMVCPGLGWVSSNFFCLDVRIVAMYFCNVNKIQNILLPSYTLFYLCLLFFLCTLLCRFVFGYISTWELKSECALIIL